MIQLKSDYNIIKKECKEQVEEVIGNVTSETDKCSYENETIPELWIVFYIFCILWLFVAIAIICDDFFVPSLEAISG